MKLKKINYTVKYNRRNHLNKNNQAPVEIMLTQVGSSAKYKNLKIYVAPKYWNATKTEIRKTHPNYFTYNNQIGEELQKMRTYENKLINTYGFCHIQRLFSEYDQLIVNETHKTFTAFFKDEISIAKIKASTLKAVKGSYTKLCQFKKEVYFEELTFDFIDRYQSFLVKQDLGARTINKHISRLKTYVNKAIVKRLISVNDNPFLNYKSLPELEPDRLYLNNSELEKWENAVFEKEDNMFEKVRDYFLLHCYTGMRYGELASLTIDDNIEESKEGLIISFRSEKTGKKVHLPIHALFKLEGSSTSKAEDLVRKLISIHLRKYKHTKNATSIPFAKLANQYFNRQLKVVAKMIGINKAISTHAGRRTFATSLYNRDIEAIEIQRLLKHSKIDMTLIYIKLSDKSIIEKLQRTKW